MSPAWSVFLIVLIVLNIVGCVWLLWYTSKRRSDLPSGETTGHTWDGDLREYNKPLPRWWINLFYLTIVFTIGYLAWYPGFGNFAGASGWTSAKQHDAAKVTADARFQATYGDFGQLSLERLASAPAAIAAGRNLFASHCAQCHGSDARGAVGFPDLTDAQWQWGSEPETILASITHGRIAAMPALGSAVGDDAAITAVATYVQRLSGMTVDPALASVGKSKFELVCAACHGADGKGNPVLGAPNLTDSAWLYRPDLATIKQGIQHGRNGQMPAFGPILGDLRTRLVAGYVLSLGRPASEAQTDTSAGAH